MKKSQYHQVRKLEAEGIEQQGEGVQDGRRASRKTGVTEKARGRRRGQDLGTRLSLWKDTSEARKEV